MMMDHNEGWYKGVYDISEFMKDYLPLPQALKCFRILSPPPGSLHTCIDVLSRQVGLEIVTHNGFLR